MEKANNTDLLTEKYRPQTIDDVVGQEHIKSDLRKYIANKDIPNMIFSGPAGTGKTTLAKILAKSITSIGNILELNASDDNGIDVMRNEVKKFAESYGEDPETLSIVILDEADNMTGPAQQALRRTIEDTSKYTRFIFICNYINRIMDPIQSRCKAKYVTQKIPDELVIARLQYIAKCENISVNIADLTNLVKSNDGDLRGNIVILDAIKKGANIKNFINKSIDKSFISYCLSGDFINLRKFIVENVNDSQALRNIIKGSMDLIIDSEKLNDSLKSQIINTLGEAEYRLVISSNHFIVALWCCAQILTIRLNQ